MSLLAIIGVTILFILPFAACFLHPDITAALVVACCHRWKSRKASQAEQVVEPSNRVDEALNKISDDFAGGKTVTVISSFLPLFEGFKQSPSVEPSNGEKQ